DKRKKHAVEVGIDRLETKRTSVARLESSVEAALKQGKGTLIVAREGHADRLVSEHLACDHCQLSFPELTPQAFSFNSPQGMCQACNGLGTRVELDPVKIVPDPALSIDEGAIAPWGEDVSEKKSWDFRNQILSQLKLDTKIPYRALKKAQQQVLLYGTGEKKYDVNWEIKSGSGRFQVTWEGVIPKLMRRFKQTQSERARKWYSQFMGDTVCSACSGGRLRPESAAVRVGGKTLVELSGLTVAAASELFQTLELSSSEREIAREVVKEIQNRLGFLKAVGLDYLS